ncbi:MAG: hypothetical protein IPP94_18535 [Ignavibacteria bacterium]|nr:hypothetical protein [Ignavibacteria bacterium]
MSSTASNNKYQVYFFLYLAVICELLIIIVERDDAEQGWMREQARLKRALADMIENLSSTVPVSVIRGATEMAVGETRSFTFTVSGLGARDEVTVAPTIVISRNGSLVDSLTQPGAIVDSVHRNAHGERVYRFAWRAPSVGQYEFRSLTGTNFIDHVNADSVKIGPLVIARRVFEEVTGKRPEELASENIRNTMLVNVVSTAEPLGVHAPGNSLPRPAIPCRSGLKWKAPLPNASTPCPPWDAWSGVAAISCGNTPSRRRANTVFRCSAAMAIAGGRQEPRACGIYCFRQGERPAQTSTGEGVCARDVPFRHRRPRFERGDAVPLDRAVRRQGTAERHGSHRRVQTALDREADGARHLRGPRVSCRQGASVFPVQVLEPPPPDLRRVFRRERRYPLQHSSSSVRRAGKRPSEFSIPIPGSDIRIEVEDEDGA